MCASGVILLYRLVLYYFLFLSTVGLYFHCCYSVCHIMSHAIYCIAQTLDLGQISSPPFGYSLPPVRCTCRQSSLSLHRWPDRCEWSDKSATINRMAGFTNRFNMTAMHVYLSIIIPMLYTYTVYRPTIYITKLIIQLMYYAITLVTLM